MKIEKFRNGYRMRKQYQGKTYTVITDYKPTQKQALELMAEKMKDAPKKICKHDMTFSEAYLAYLDLKSNILSPSTKRGYKSVYNCIPRAFLDKRINEIDSVDVQKVINDYSANHAPKSTRNLYGLISIVLKTYVKNINLEIQLPQKVKSEPYIPTDEEVKAVMAELKGTKYYIPLCLASLGMRKSEIVALTIKDLDENNCLTINKAKVADENGELVEKTTKTTESTRKIYIPSDLADMIREQGYIYKGFPDCITRALGKAQDKLGIQHFTTHKLRHFFASYAHNELHLSDKQIMDAGGWKTSAVLDSVYKHSMKEEQAKKQIADSFGNLF